MNIEITTTNAPVAQSVTDLIIAHIEATAEHQRVFTLCDWRLPNDKDVDDCSERIDDIYTEIYVTDPADKEEADLKREYLLFSAPKEGISADLAKRICAAYIRKNQNNSAALTAFRTALEVAA